MTTSGYDLQELESLLIRVVEEETGESGITLGTSLQGIDSLTFSEILMNVEKEFDVEFGLEEAFSLGGGATVGALLEAMAERLP
ncbi:acyl carrier protein [Streptomyces sp. NPDC056244]|uniref:acyl carrier protein n=1 Tax=unclassified Streptomyces TaxID=2593676 RepID=UPI0035D81FAC